MLRDLVPISRAPQLGRTRNIADIKAIHDARLADEDKDMRVSSIRIKNFRALEDIYTEFASP